MIENAPLPDFDADSAPFWEGCARGELLVQTCRSCSAVRFPPRPMCPACRSTEMTWHPAAGTATVWSYVVSHPPLLPAFMPFAPYPVVVVELDDHAGVRMVGNLVAAPGAAVNSVDPAGIEIGMAVRVSFETVAEGVALPRWVPA